MSLAAVVPAAGRSARMGEPKLLLRYRGEPLVRRAVRLASAWDPEPIVVLRSGDSDLPAALAGMRWRAVRNPDPARGPASSIACGIRAALARAADGGAPVPAVLVLLPDMPRVDAAALCCLISGYRGGRPEVGVTARHGDLRSPPVVLPPALLTALTAAEGRLKDALAAAGHTRRPVELPRDVLDDADTPADRVRLGLTQAPRGRPGPSASRATSGRPPGPAAHRTDSG